MSAKVLRFALTNVNLREHDYYYYRSYQSNGYYKADQEAEQAIGS